MKKMMQVLFLVLAFGLFSGCSGTQAIVQESITPTQEATVQKDEPSQVETRIFVDSTGREVELPERITKVAVSGALAQMMLVAIAPEMMVGLATDWDGTAEQYLDDSYYNLPILGQLYGTSGDLNFETLLLAEPQVIIDIGEPKDSIVEDMDALQEKTGIPTIHISAYLDDYAQTFVMLGELLDKPEEAEVLSAYCKEVYTLSTTLMEQVGEDKVEVVYCLGEDGTNVIAQGSYQAELLNMMTENIAVLENPTAKGTGNEVDLEQLLQWNPDVIVFSYGSIFDTVGDDSRWIMLDAISNDTYYETPFGPYNWTGNPPSIQRYLGMIWCAQLLYPEYVTYDLETMVDTYYRLFYHCDLTDAQYQALIEKSIGKAGH